MRKNFLHLLCILLVSLPLFAGEKWEVYFTNPQKLKNTGVKNPQDGLISMIRDCHKSFHGAFYDISSMKIADELIAAHNRGIDVRLVTEKDTFSGDAITKILESGIPVVTDSGPGLMHNKFAIADGSSVFTGSYNTTDNCTLKNNNNAIIVHSQELAEIYTSEFSEMFDHRIFANRREHGAFAELQKKYYVKLDGININVYFAPEDNVEKIIHDRIKKARESIRFMYFSFTSDNIGELMIEKFKAGIKVQGVFEKKGSGSEHSEYIKMKIEGLPVRLDKNRHVMHHKIIIIDDVRVITGSYNLSNNANKRNDENIIIIDSPEIAGKYIEEFHRIYGREDNDK
jgi:phosphatidylserine/phosphatidylglycerophosphate/cardiolipin synthase-like enzyme